MKDKTEYEMVTKNLLAYIQNKNFSSIEKYLKEGRKYKTEITEELKEIWIEQTKVFFLNHSNDDIRKTCEDIESELTLRNDSAPYDKVEKEFNIFKTILYTSMLNLSEVRTEEINEQILDDLKKFIDESKSKN